jgi:hypothetical protein
MPSKSAHLIAFLSIFALSAASHRFVYVHLKQLILRDFTRRAKAVRRSAATLFLLMELPFVYLFLSKWIAAGHDVTTRILIYPFTLWQGLMLFWTAILLVRLFVRRTATAGVSIARYTKTTIATRTQATTDALEPSQPL